MKYQIGEQVVIRSYEAMKREFGVDENGQIKTPEFFFNMHMKKCCGSTMTIASVVGNTYRMKEDSRAFAWTDKIIAHNFKYGEEIEVSDNGVKWVKKIFVGYIDGGIDHYGCVDALSEDDFRNGKPFFTYWWIHARKLQSKVECIIDGEKLMLSRERVEELKRLGE